MKILIEREPSSDKQTLGALYLLDNNNSVIDSFFTLELPWEENQRRISCIPIGKYKAILHNSPKFGKTLWLQNVPNRSEILVHSGNYHTQILGCVLIGSDFKDINNDGYLDVVNSRNSMKKLLSYLDQDEIEIEVKDTKNSITLAD